MLIDAIKSLFRLVLFLVFIVVLLTTVCYFLLNSPQYLERLVPLAWNASPVGKSLPIRSLSIGKSQLRFPEKFIFGDVLLKFENEKTEYAFGFNAVDILNLSAIWEKDSSLAIQVYELQLQSPEVELKKAIIATSIYFLPQGLNFRGEMNQADLTASGYTFSAIRAKFAGDQTRVIFDEFLANFYGGQIKAKISLDYKPRLTYSVEAKLTNVDFQKLERVNQPVFSQVRGIVNGEIAFSGIEAKIQSLSGSFENDSGGEIKAALLEPFVAYIPQGSQRSRIETLAKEDGYLPYRSVNMRIESLTQKQLRTVVNLDTQEVSFQDSHIDLNLDADISDWLDTILQLSKGKGGRK